MGQGDDVKIAGEVVPMHRLRGFLQGYLADKKGRPVSIDADPSTPYSAVATVLDAVRDNGARNVQIRAVRERER